MKTKCISLLPSSHLYFTSVVHCRRPCLFIPLIASLPCVLGNVQSNPFAPHGPCSWFLGRYPRWTPLKLVYIFSNPTFFFLSRLFTSAGDFTIYHTYPDFIAFPCINQLSISPLPLYQCITSDPRPTIQPPFPFHQVIFLFLVCISDYSIGTRVVVYWRFITVFLRYLAFKFLSSNGHVCYWWLLLPASPVNNLTPILIPSPSFSRPLSLLPFC